MSLLICLCLIFNFFGSFIYASSISIAQEFQNYCLSRGYQQGIPYLPSYFHNLTGYNSRLRENWDKFCSYNYGSTLYFSTVSDKGDKSLVILKYNSFSSNSTETALWVSDAVLISISSSFDSYGLESVSSVLSIITSNRSAVLYNTVYNNMSRYIQFGGSSFSSGSSGGGEVSRWWQCLKDWFFKDGVDTSNFIFGDDSIKDWTDNIARNWIDYLRNLLKLSDTVDIQPYLDDIYNNNYNSLRWSDVDLKTQANIKVTSNNLKQFYNDTYLLTSYDETTNRYYFDTKNDDIFTSYNSSDYFNDYIVNNISYGNDVDFSQILNYLVCIESDLGRFCNILISFDSYLSSFTSLLADIKGGILGLGGVFAGAIGIAWADIKIDLDSLFDDLIIDIDSLFDSFMDDFIIKLNDKLKLSFDFSSNDDTTNNFTTSIKSSFKSVFKDLEFIADFRNLLDELTFKVNLVSDDSDDIPSQPQPSNPDESVSDDFFLEFRKIVLSKIPFFSSCIDLLSFITNLSADSLFCSVPSMLPNNDSFIENYSFENDEYGFDSDFFYTDITKTLTYSIDDDIYTETCYSFKCLSYIFISSKTNSLCVFYDDTCILSFALWNESFVKEEISQLIATALYFLFAFKVCKRCASMYQK